MANSTQKAHSSTQKFIEIVDIVDNVVLLNGGNACMVIEVTSSNFALLSKKEQDTKIYAYAAMLNSLTFPIQILIRNKRIDISSYLKLLEQAEKKTQNELLATHISLYREFVQEMVQVNVVLNKTFYIVVPYSSLEGGVTSAVQSAGGKKPAVSEAELAASAAKKALAAKAESLLGQLVKFAVSAKVLEKDDLVKLFYDTFNDGIAEVAQIEDDINTVMIQANQKV